MPTGVVFTTSAAPARAAARGPGVPAGSWPQARASRPGAQGPQAATKRLRRCPVAARHPDPARTQLHQARHHRPGTAAAAEHQGLAGAPGVPGARGRVLGGVLGAQGRQKSLHVGVAAQPAAFVAPHQGVHRPQPAGQGGQLRRQVRRRLLVGQGDVEAAAVERRQGPQHHGQVRRRHRQGQVDPVQAQGGEGGVVHRRGEGVAHRIPQHPRQGGAATDHRPCRGERHGLAEAAAARP